MVLWSRTPARDGDRDLNGGVVAGDMAGVMSRTPARDGDRGRMQTHREVDVASWITSVGAEMS